MTDEEKEQKCSSCNELLLFHDSDSEGKVFFCNNPMCEKYLQC